MLNAFLIGASLWLLYVLLAHINFPDGDWNVPALGISLVAFSVLPPTAIAAMELLG